MKNKKGFTLIELLAVLVILSIVALVTIPNITNSLKSYKDDLYETQVANIEKAARVWGADHLYILPNDSSSDVEVKYDRSTQSVANLSNPSVIVDDYKRLSITLEDLQSEGYIDKDLKNIRKTDENGKVKEFDSSLEIIIEKNGNQLEYTVIDQEFYAYAIGDRVRVTLGNSNTKEFIIINDSSSRYKTVKAIYADGDLGTITWNSSADNTLGPLSINQKLDEYVWPNVITKRLITIDEVENVLYKLRNTNVTDRNWILGDYWTGTSFGTQRAYVVPTTYTVPTVVSSKEDINLKVNDNTMLVNTTHKLKPVIEIEKKYIKIVSKSNQ